MGRKGYLRVGERERGRRGDGVNFESMYSSTNQTPSNIEPWTRGEEKITNS